MNMILVKVTSCFEKVVAIPKAIWFVAGVVIGLPTLMSLAVTNEGSWANFATSVAVIAWLIGGVVLTLTWLTKIDGQLIGHNPWIKMTIVILVHIAPMLILAPMPLLTAFIAVKVGWLAGILTGSSLAILYLCWYWPLPQEFPKLKVWNSAPP